MRTYLKDSNSKKIFLYMVDSTDHVTPETGATVAVKVSKNGAAFGAGGGSVAELEEGVYAYTPSAGDVDTLGPIAFKATASGCDPFIVEGLIVAVDPYTAKFGLNDLAAGAAMTLTAAYDKAKDDVLTPLAVVDGLVDTLISRLTETRAGYLDAAISSRGTLTAGQVRTELATELARILKGLPDAIPGENGGLPTTNGTKLNQTADLTAGQEISADVTKIGGVAQSATDLKDFADSGYDPSTHKVQGVVLADTATTLTNLPAVTADWLTAAGVKADAVAKIQNGLATPTNITAGTITTVTNLTNAPTNGDLTATMKTSVQTAADAAVTANTKIVAIEADTNEVQAELADGGRTDLLIDAIKAITDQINFTGTDVNANASVALTEGDISDIADGVAAAIKLTTGWTAGGTLTYAEVVKIIAAAVAGKVIDKAGVAGTIQHLDVEDGVTAIFENVPSNTTSPYRDPTIL